MHGSSFASHTSQGAGQTDRLREATGAAAVPDRSGAVLALVVGDLVRTWTKQARKRGPRLTTPIGDVLQRTREENICKP